MTESVPKLEDFDFDLPEGQIARYPAAQRDESRLLVIDRQTGALQHRVFRDLPALLRPGDVLVLNRTKVRQARVRGKRATGGGVELLFLEEHAPGIWKVRAKPTTKLKPGEPLILPQATVSVGERLGEHLLVKLTPDTGLTADEWFSRVGEMPIPPYFKRKAEPMDRERYQTVYAGQARSVAAPTAGLHFTPELLDRIRRENVVIRFLDLAVGWGTFQPVRNEVLEQGVLESETYEIPAETARAIVQARSENRRVIAVGTTTTRALESAWRVTPPALTGSTRLFIHEPYTFRCIDGLITNFHLPQSSLLMLVAAFAGRENILKAYREAVGMGYRFYSYGDACFIA
ncbi:MAG: tRNA preQ1(34) S-adenosylmethionine ribosyltransferase-isomerase QueA [Deltaproteobacteria bacterium]|nr:tRNA preQ1(34) S-adenosylmethionine ribosyltransferase-isomerase QueA [Deltaproteobacteria bacterium]